MIKNIIPFLIVISLFVGYPMADIVQASTTASGQTSVAKPTAKKAVVKKKAVKKKVTKKKERLIPAPALYTLDNAPYSDKPISKAKKKAKKKVIKKI